MVKRYITATTLISLLILAGYLFSHKAFKKNILYREKRILLGTFVEVISPDKKAIEISFDEIKRIEGLLSKYNPKSDISILNKEGLILASPEAFYIIEKAKEFYYLMMTDFDKKVKTCRWLVFDGKNLYLNNYIKKDVSNVEFVYLSCVGNENCNPNIYNLDGKDYWICGDNPICLKEGQTRAGCDIYTTFIGN